MNSKLLIAIVVVQLSQSFAAPVPSWPAFRGPNASGVSETAKPPIQFGPDENVLWKVEVPFSPSSPCIWGDRIFLTTFADGQLQTRCYCQRRSESGGRLAV